MRHYYNYKAGICFKCRASKVAGARQCLVSGCALVSLAPRYTNPDLFETIPRLTHAEFINDALRPGCVRWPGHFSLGRAMSTH